MKLAVNMIDLVPTTPMEFTMDGGRPMDGFGTKTKLEVAEMLEEAAQDLNDNGWCTGDLFQKGGKACAIGNLLKTTDIIVDFIQFENDDEDAEEWFPQYKRPQDAEFSQAEPYDHPDIQDALFELAKDILTLKSFKETFPRFFFETYDEWRASEPSYWAGGSDSDLAPYREQWAKDKAQFLSHPDSIVWQFNDNVGQTPNVVRDQFLFTVKRLRDEAAL